MAAAVVVVVVVELEELDPPPHPASKKGKSIKAKGAIFFITTPKELGFDDVNNPTLANVIIVETSKYPHLI